MWSDVEQYVELCGAITKVTRLEGYKVRGLEGYRVTGLKGYRVTGVAIAKKICGGGDEY
jgi:hypothetical protein